MIQLKDVRSPFALPQGPGGDDPEADHEHEQHRARADCHQGLQHEPREIEGLCIDSMDEYNFFHVFTLSE